MVVDKTPLDLRFLNIFILSILTKRYSSNWSELVSIIYSIYPDKPIAFSKYSMFLWLNLVFLKCLFSQDFEHSF